MPFKSKEKRNENLKKWRRNRKLKAQNATPEATPLENPANPEIIQQGKMPTDTQLNYRPPDNPPKEKSSYNEIIQAARDGKKIPEITLKKVWNREKGKFEDVSITEITPESEKITEITPPESTEPINHYQELFQETIEKYFPEHVDKGFVLETILTKEEWFALLEYENLSEDDSPIQGFCSENVVYIPIFRNPPDKIIEATMIHELVHLVYGFGHKKEWREGMARVIKKVKEGTQPILSELLRLRLQDHLLKDQLPLALKELNRLKTENEKLKYKLEELKPKPKPIKRLDNLEPFKVRMYKKVGSL